MKMVEIRKDAPAERELTPRERAELRAQEVLEHNNGDISSAVDKFSIPEHIVPDGWTYEWKTKLVYGAEDPSHEIELARKGWEPVPASRHPDMMPYGYEGKEIMRDGMILMERPTSLVERARSNSYRKAVSQVRSKEEQLTTAPAGQFDRNNKDNSMVKVKKAIEAMKIPE